MLLDSMHLVKVAVLSEFLSSSSSFTSCLTSSDDYTDTRAFIHINSNDTLMLSEHLIVQRSCELRSCSESRSHSE